MKEFKVIEKGLEFIGYPGYTVTNDGKIYSFRSGIKKELALSNHNGYRRVSLSKKGKSKHLYVHRIVAQAFLDKQETEQKLEVNHKDGNKSNNCIDNLEWVTHSENMAHALNTGLIPEMSLPKAVLQIDKDTGDIVNEFKSMLEAVRIIGVSRKDLRKVLKGERKTASGYFWRLKQC